MRCRSKILVVIVVVGTTLVAGCVSYPTPSTLPLRDESAASRDRYAQDLQACTEQTRTLVNAERPTEPSMRLAIFGRVVGTMMARKMEQRKIDAYLHKCLEARGYQFIPGGQEGSGVPAR